MQDKNDLLAGQVFTSSSGKLPCKCVIHAVGPRWRGGTHGEHNELFEAIVGSLEEAEKISVKSLAMPIISSGIFGFPLDEASRVICEAIAYFFQTKQSGVIDEVHLIDTKEPGGRSIKKAVQKYLCHGPSHSSVQNVDLPTGKVRDLFSLDGSSVLRFVGSNY